MLYLIYRFKYHLKSIISHLYFCFQKPHQHSIFILTSQLEKYVRKSEKETEYQIYFISSLPGGLGHRVAPPFVTSRYLLCWACYGRPKSPRASLPGSGLPGSCRVGELVGELVLGRWYLAAGWWVLGWPTWELPGML